MSQIRRRQLWVDAKVQGTLLLHVILYWLYCLLTVTVMALVCIVFSKRPSTSVDLFQELWLSCGPALLGSVLLLPLVLLDCLRFSNRFSGPMVRLHREIKAMADGEVSRSVQLRDGDFWLEFAEDWNRVVARYSTAGNEEPAKVQPTSTPAAPTANSPCGAASPTATSICADTVSA